MRGRSTITPEAVQVEYVIADVTAPIDLRTLFPTEAPLELDLGCGDGSFITALAVDFPHRNFLGVERLVGRVRSACHKITTRALTNARILRVDIGSAVTSLIPTSSVDVCYIMFPDPWPKRRHHRRRTVTPELLRGITRILKPHGVIRLATDDAPYFAQMQQAAAAVRELAAILDDDAEMLPRSTFERRFVEHGLPIHRLSLRKVSPETYPVASQ